MAPSVAAGLSYVLVGLPIVLVSYVRNHRSKMAATGGEFLESRARRN